MLNIQHIAWTVKERQFMVPIAHDLQRPESRNETYTAALKARTASNPPNHLQLCSTCCWVQHRLSALRRGVSARRPGSAAQLQ